MSESVLKIAMDAKNMGEMLADRFDRHLDKQDKTNIKLFDKIDELKDIIMSVRFEAKDADFKTNIKMYGILFGIANAVYGGWEGLKHLFTSK